MPEHPTTRIIRDASAGPGVEPDRDDGMLFPGRRLTESFIGHVADQARRTVEAAKAGRVVSRQGEPGVLDVVLDPTPLSELLHELVEEVRRLRPRQQIAQLLRRAADIIDAQAPTH